MFKAIFNSHGADSSLRDRDGDVVDVISLVDEKEYDKDDVGEMYRVRFEDGVEIDAFDDELLRCY